MKPPYKHRWIRLGLLCLSLSTALWPIDSSATDASFNLNGVVLTLTEAGADAGVHFQSMRLNRAQNVWNVEVWVTNRSVRVLQGPLVLRVDSFSGTTGPLQADGVDNNSRPYYDLSSSVPGGMLLPGQKSNPRTLALGVAAGAPQMAAAVFVMPSLSTGPAGLVRTLDEVGQPLTSVVAVDEKSGITNRTDDTFGVATLSGKAGDHVWRFDRSGYYPVWRAQALVTDRVVVVPSPRLTPRGTNSALATPIGGGLVADAASAMQIRLPPGAFSQEVRLLLTPLTGQSLPALLPQGWSPLQAFWLDCEKEPAIPATAGLQPWGAISAGEVAALVKWNGAELRWETVQVVTGKGTDPLTVSLPGSGAYALVIADPGAIAPPAAAVGSPLSASSVRLPDPGSLSADGRVEPNSSPASRQPELVTAQATVIISNASGALPSGLLLRGVVNEVYSLRNGAKRPTPQYENFLVGYQRPGDGLTATLTATFPIRPQLLYGAEELDTARVQVEVVAPEAFAGGLLDEAGGQVAAGGLRILAGAGDLSGVGAIQTRWLEASNYVAVFGGALSVIRAFDLITGAVSPGRKLVAQFDGLPTNLTFVLAKVLSRGGWYGLEPRERLRTDVQGRLASLEPATQPRLDGITGPGQYLLIQVDAAQGLITGVVRNSAGQPAGGWPVSLSGLPWLTFSDPNGAYRLVAGTGPVQVAVSDLATGDRGQASTSLTNSQVATTADVGVAAVGPVASLLTPTNGATAVARVSRVVVAFSRPIAPGSLLNGGLRLLATDNSTVTATLTLSLDNITATLLPTDPLAANTFFTVLVSTNIQDTTGRPLVGNSSFTFKTQNNALDRAGAQLISYEPTNGLAPIFGTPGTADPESPVLLVNETSGGTATILSRPDGSFTNVIAAGVDDFLSAVLVNQNGTRTTIPVSRQVFQDGSVGLFNGGGLLEAQSDGGPVQVLVEPGAIVEKAKFKVQVLDVTQLGNLLSNGPPQSGQVLGGIVLSQEGDELKVGADLSFPINPATLNLAAGTRPEDASFALAVPHEYEDGNVNYEIIDRMLYENGKLVTHSPPYLGLLLKKILYGDALARRVDKMSGKIFRMLGLPNLEQTATHLLALPIMLAQGHSITICGRVGSVEFDANGDPATGSERPVPGALVTVENDAFSSNDPSWLGRLKPGQYFATAGSEGRYSFYVPLNSLEAQGFLLTAIHPAFPHQRAVGGASVLNLAARLQNENILSVPLFLGRASSGSTNLGPDSDAPLISVAQSPWDPMPGTNTGAGVLLSVFATDDQNMANLTLVTDTVTPLNPLETDSAVRITLTNSQTVGTRAVNAYRITSEHKAQVNLLITATDGSGNTNTAGYQLVFDGDKVRAVPLNTNDHTGPRIIASWPLNNSTGVRPFDPIVIRFSEPIRNSATTNIASWLQFASPHAYSRVAFSADGRELTIWYSGQSSGNVNLSLGQGLTDVNGNPLDNNPATPSQDNFNLTFTLAGNPTGDLPGVTMGGGVVTKGNYAYALERTGDLDGAVLVYDLTRPTNAVKVATLKVPGYPRDLALIPQYTYTTTTNKTDCITNDLLAVVGGKVGAEDFQYLWVLDIGDPAHIKRLASAVVTYAQTAIVKLKWSPPFLAYLENGAGNSAISLVNLQTFIIGALAPAEQRLAFTTRVAGIDADGDGNFCGPNDELPLPFNSTSDYYGRVTSFAISDTTQTIGDFDMDSNLGLLGVTLSAGFVIGSNGQPTSRAVPPAYRTLVSGLADLDSGLATLGFDPADVPRRLAVLPQVLLQTTNSVPLMRNLALVSLDARSGYPTRLEVIDITDPLAPTNLATLAFPANFANCQSILRREDGLLAVATMNDLLLLDPAKMLLPIAATTGLPAAVVGMISGGGGGSRSFAVSASGLNLVNSGGKHVLLQSPPRIDIVSFPDLSPTNVGYFQQLPETAKRARLFSAQSQLLLVKNHFQFRSSTNGLLANGPPTPATHYFVRLDAPGSAGSNLDLFLESWGANGTPLPSGSSNALPVHLGSRSTLAGIGDTNQSVFPTVLSARRLSDDPRSAYYNLYLAGPLVLSEQVINAIQRNAVSNQLPRLMLRPGKSLWIGLDPGLSSNAVVGPFASSLSNRRVKPADARWVKVENTERPLIFIPGISGSYLEDTNSTLASLSECWPGWAKPLQEKLSLDPAGQVTDSIMPGDIIRTILKSPLDAVKIYSPVLNFLTSDAGYVEYRYDRVNGVVVDDNQMYRYRIPDQADMTQLTNNPNLFVFPYDWRLDNATSAAALRQYVDLIRRFHPEADRVDILAHSMGGLLARRFILDNPDTVDKLITIATPWVGAPKAIAALERGDMDNLAMNIIARKDLLKALVEYMPGMHQLLPSQAYFELGGRPLLEGSWNMNRDTNYFEIYDYSTYEQVVDGVFHGGTNVSPVLTNQLFHAFSGPTNQPAASRNHQDNWANDSTGVDYYHIYGVQALPRTIGQVKGTTRLRPVELKCNDLRIDLPWEPVTDSDALLAFDQNLFEGHDRYLLDHRFEYVRTLGDGTVPVLSASRLSPTNNYNAPNARLLPLFSPSGDRDGEVEHNGILANTNLFSLLLDIISGIEPAAATNHPATNESFIVNLANAVPDSAVLADGSGGTSAALQVTPDDWVARILNWFSEEDENSFVSQFLIMNSQPGNTKHILAFDVGDQPFGIDVYRGFGGITTNLYRWTGGAIRNTRAELTIDWPSHRPSLKVFGTNVPPSVSLTNALAQSDFPPKLKDLLQVVQSASIDTDDEGKLLLNIHDDLFRTNDLALYMAYDHNEDGNVFDEVFRELSKGLLTTNSPLASDSHTMTYALPVPAVETQPMWVAGANSGGVVSPEHLIASPPTTPDAGFCGKVGDERAAMLAAIQAGVDAVNASGWILNSNPASSLPPGIRYLLEQGSGACFWNEQPPPCDACQDIFTINVSDHDYEVFLPVFSPYYVGAVPDVANHPYDRTNVIGDWYFKPPVTNGGFLVYQLPPGAGAPILRPVGFPLTPANYISQMLSDVASNSLVAAGFEKAAANMSFFSVRAEHFENGYIDLELPLESGPDPLGDAGTGRQMLMLKWVLEGNYVPGFQGPPLEGNDPSNVYEQFKRHKIKPLEGFEWAIYQEFSALGAGLMLRVTDLTGPAHPEPPAHDFIYDIRKKQIKYAGKACIRAALGVLVSSSLPNRDDLIYIDRPAYRAKGYRAFEQYIAGQVANAMSLFPGSTTQDINDFYLAKVADPTLLKSLLEDQCRANQFLAKAVKFLRTAQNSTTNTYSLSVPNLPPDERDKRQENMNKVWNGFPNLGKPGLNELHRQASLNLTVRLMNDGPRPAPSTQVIMTGGPTARTLTTNLGPDSITLLEGKAAKGKYFYLQAPLDSPPTEVRFTIKSAGGLEEARVTNNWFGFTYYMLNLEGGECNIPSDSTVPPDNLPRASTNCKLPFGP